MFHDVVQWNTLLETPHGPSPPEGMESQRGGGGGGDKPNLLDMFFKCFLATESVRETNLELRGITNKGSLEETGNS